MNPQHYLEGVPRVSDIVSHFYPFEGTESEKYYLAWLSRQNVSRDEYLAESQRVGTATHKAIETFLEKGDCGEVSGNEERLSASGLLWLSDNKITKSQSEIHIVHPKKLYQGTADMLCMVDGKKTIVDWKTWGAAKLKFGMDYTYRHPSPKLEKVRLQLSLYAMVLRASQIICVELRTDGYKEHRMERLPNSALNLLLKEYGRKRAS